MTVAGIEFNIWSIIILLAATQGIFLALYLLFKKRDQPANKWIAFLLIVISLHLLEYAADISELVLRFPIIIAITYPLLFCMGPLYLIYCRTLLDSSFKAGAKTSLHFIPALLVLLLMLPFYMLPAGAKIGFVQGLAQGDRIIVPLEQFIFMGMHIMQTVAYVYLNYRYVEKKRTNLGDFSADVAAMNKLEWLNTFNKYFSIYLLLYFIVVVLLVAVDSYQVQVDYVMLLITSAAIFLIGYSALDNPDVFQSIPNTDGGRDKRSNPAKHPELKERLIKFMETDKPYLKSDLRISDLANDLRVTDHVLSQLINDEFNVNFYDFINRYRIEDAKQFLTKEGVNAKILAVAFEVGFNSKATFNRAFQKFASCTPSQFRERVRG